MHGRPLETPRLLLRPPTPADIPGILATAGDWEVARVLSRIPHPYGVAEARYFLDVVVPAEWVWAITLRPAGPFVGAVGLTPSPDPAVAELGYYLHRDLWGQGLVTEAAAAVIRHGFAALGLRRITSGHYQDNPASGRVLAKLGFTETGQDERPCLATGSARPAIALALLPPGAG